MLDLLQGLSRRLPSQCAICHRWPSHALCEDCVATLAQPVPRCSRCALQVPDGVAVCGECLLHPAPLDACLCAVDYAFPWSDLVAEFKFRGAVGLARPLAQLLRAANGVDAALEQADAVIPLPLAPARLRSRGYNQALELARALEPAKVDTTLLLRTQDGPPQHGLPRHERLHAVAHAFAVEPLQAPRVSNRRLVLIDDVMTTGASLHAGARALRQAGAAHITALVLARTPP